MEFNDKTKAQIVKIQLFDIIKYCANILEDGNVMPEDVEKIQLLFKIINNKPIDKNEKNLIENIGIINNIIL